MLKKVRKKNPAPNALQSGQVGSKTAASDMEGNLCQEIIMSKNNMEDKKLASVFNYYFLLLNLHER